MSELLSNYWVGLLILGPIAGVFWALLFGRGQRQALRRAEYNMDGNSGQIVVGSNNNTKQVKNSYNPKTVNNYNGVSKKDGDDPMAFGLLALGGVLLICSMLSWGMAKYGDVIIALELALVSVIGVFLLFHMVPKYFSGEYSSNELPSSLILVAAVGFAFITVQNLDEFLRVEATDMVVRYTNVFQFFFDLSRYGKALLITQALSVIFILLNQIYVVARAYGIQRGHYSWYLDVFLVLPVLGFLPLWLSNPNWSVSFILARLA